MARLVARKLVLRAAAPHDARRIEVSLTARGRAIARSAPEAIQVRLAEALGSMTPAARGRLARGLSDLVAKMGLRGSPRMFFEEDAGRVSTAFVSPADNHLGVFVVIVPVLGGIVVGGMARWGSAAIRGHGIPEAMEQVLFNESRVAPRLTLLKPVSAAVAIGTGGPFGAEGPIIATGGAIGSGFRCTGCGGPRWVASRWASSAMSPPTLSASATSTSSTSSPGRCSGARSSSCVFSSFSRG